MEISKICEFMRNLAMFVKVSNVRTPNVQIISAKDLLCWNITEVYNKVIHLNVVYQKTFTFKKVLQNHMKLVHNQSKAELKYVCDACGKGFNNQNYFQQHFDRHKDQK